MVSRPFKTPFLLALVGLPTLFPKLVDTRTVPREWPTPENLKIPREKSLPDVLSVQKVRRLIGSIRKGYLRVCLWIVYSCRPGASNANC